MDTIHSTSAEIEKILSLMDSEETSEDDMRKSWEVIEGHVTASLSKLTKQPYYLIQVSEIRAFIFVKDKWSRDPSRSQSIKYEDLQGVIGYYWVGQRHCST